MNEVFLKRQRQQVLMTLPVKWSAAYACGTDPASRSWPSVAAHTYYVNHSRLLKLPDLGWCSSSGKLPCSLHDSEKSIQILKISLF